MAPGQCCEDCSSGYEVSHGPPARYVNLRVAHAPGIPGTFSPPPRVCNPDMHHGTCVTHVPWCMPGLLTSRFLWSRRWGKMFPAHAQAAILRSWQEAHWIYEQMHNIKPSSIAYSMEKTLHSCAPSRLLGYMSYSICTDVSVYIYIYIYAVTWYTREIKQIRTLIGKGILTGTAMLIIMFT